MVYRLLFFRFAYDPEIKKRGQYLNKLSHIIQGCIENDRKCQQVLYNQVFDLMMGICMRYCKSEDLAMETLNMAFLKIVKNLKSYNHSCDLHPWVATITVNEAIDAYRKKVRRREFIDDNQYGLENIEETARDEQTLDFEQAEYLEHLLEGLKESEKLVFNLFAIDGYSHKEIAEMMDITERSSIRHLTNARRKLQEKIPASEMRIKKA